MCYTYDGVCDIFIETEPKARKEHTCSECRLPIEKKEQYYRLETLYDGSWETSKLHLSCKDYRKMVYDHEREEGCDYMESWPPIGELDETMIQRITEIEGWEEYHEHCDRRRKIATLSILREQS